MKKYLLILLLTLSLVGCKTLNCIPVVEYRDSIRTEYKLDSIYVYRSDSIFVDRYRSGDTIWLTTERWSVRYKDKIVEKHDTIILNNETTVVLTEEVIPKFYKNCTIGFWILLVIVLLIIVVKILIKVYLKK